MSEVLFIPSWYPNRTAKDSGNFIRRLIEADSLYDSVSVLFATPDNTMKNKYEIIVKDDNAVLEVKVYFRQIRGDSPLIIPLKAFRRVKAYRLGLKEILKRRKKPELIHVQSALPALLYARRLAVKLKIPYLVTEHGLGYYVSKKNTLTEILLFHALKSAYNGASKIITVSKFLGDAMKNKGLCRSYKVIPNSVPLPDLPPSALAASPKKRIIHISTLAPVKNAHGIINAIKEVWRQRQDFELVIVSEADEQKELRHYVSEAGLGTETVRFLPYIDDVKELLELLYSSSFMLLFSNYETFSVVLAESLWAGRPVITSRCGGPQEFITAEFGILLEPGDEKTLAEAILTMLDTWQNYDSRKMREFARSHFAPSVIGKEIYETHRDVLKKQ